MAPSKEEAYDPMSTPSDGKAAPRRILVKLSGEALMGDADYGIDPAFIKRLAGELRAMQENWPKIRFHALREHAGLVFQKQLDG